MGGPYQVAEKLRKGELSSAGLRKKEGTPGAQRQPKSEQEITEKTEKRYKPGHPRISQISRIEKMKSVPIREIRG
jgi:hypothetical protein